MTVYQFALIVEGPDLQADDLVDALFAAGCDDALVGCVDGVQYLDFDRDAASLEEAILSAVADVERVDGAEVVRLAGAGVVSMAEIATRTGRTRESVRLLVAGERGPGGFPPPMTDPRSRYRLWYWSDVARWFADSFDVDIAHPDDHVRAAISAGLEMRYHARHLDPDRRSDLNQLIAR